MSRFIKYDGKLVKFADKLLKMAEWIYNEGVYYLRVKAGGGTVANRGLVEDLYKLWDEQGRLDNIRVAILPQAGGVQRTSGIYRFFSKLFTLRTDANDVVQTTANSQPYVVGGAMVNPNGANRFITHPTVSFADGVDFTISILVKPFNTVAINYVAGTASSFFYDLIRIASNEFAIAIGNATTNTTVTIAGANRYNDKNVYVTYTVQNREVKIYVNGQLVKTQTVTNSAFNTNRFFNEYFGRIFVGSGSFYLVQSGAITTTKILEEYNLLRSYIPEIATTLIGTKNIATENCQMVATPMGRVITLQNTPATWATASTIYANTYAATSGTVAQKTSAALLAAAMWRSPDSDHDKQAVFGKIYNDYAAALMRFDIDAYNTANPSTPWGYHVMTRAEEQALAALDADTLKSNSLWTSTNGTNETGLSLLGTGVINADGTYSDFGGKTRLMTGEGYALDVNDEGASTEIPVTTEGGVLRLVKD